MKIEACRFGEVTINGITYTRDVIVFPDEVQENWWRREGHSLVKEDLGRVFEARPRVFVLGCGQYGALRVPEETVQALADAGIRIVALKTPEACDELNRLFEQGAEAAGGLHLTC